MNWTDLLRPEMEATYLTVERLMDLTDPTALGWKPPSGQNWMTVGQLLRHLSSACGSEMRGFVMGEWGQQAKASRDAAPQPAGRMPAVASVTDAKKLLAADRRLAFQMLSTAGEERLGQEPAPAPWDATRMLLGRRLLEVVRHLDSHKGQLFYYLKLQGKPVHSGHLWGT